MGQMCIDTAASSRAFLKEVISLGIQTATTRLVELNDDYFYCDPVFSQFPL